MDGMDTLTLGTTIVAVKYKDGVMLACDCRTASGTFVTDRSAIKANLISPSVVNYGPIYVLRCGNAASSQVVTRHVYNYLHYHAMELGTNGVIDLKTVATLYKNLCYPNKDFIGCAFIISNGKEIMSIDSSGAVFQNDLIASFGSGSAYIAGLLDTNVRDDMTREEVYNLLIKSVGYAVDHDASSGGNINVFDLTKTGEIKRTIFDRNEIEKVVFAFKELKTH